MNIRQMKHFLTIVEKGSITGAAQALFLSPQALHQQINGMEDELGFTLVQRSKKGIILTDAGYVFYQHVSQMMEEYQAMLVRARRIARKQELTLTICSNNTLSDEIYQNAVFRFIQQHPEITVSLSSPETGNVQNADILLNDMILPPEFSKGYTINFDQLYGYTGPEHELKAYEAIDWETLFRYPLILSSIPIIIKRNLPRFWKACVAKAQYTEIEDTHEIMPFFQKNAIYLTCSHTKSAIRMRTPHVIRDTVYPVQLYSKDPPSPCAKAYLDCVLPFYQTHWNHALRAEYEAKGTDI